MSKDSTIHPAQLRSRSKLARRSKLQQVWILGKKNGIPWTSCFLVYCAFQIVADKLNSWLEQARISRALPGVNSVESQRAIWDSWNWQEQGEEWTYSPEWKNSIVQYFIHRWIPSGSRILEIGPGAGRWTEYLIPRASEMHLVDLSQACLDECKKRFGDVPLVQFHLNNGSDLSCVADSSIDRIWSFDCFVHIDSPDVKCYVQDFARVLRSEGIGIIHHGSSGTMKGWRSRLTSNQMKQYVADSGMRILECVTSWEIDGQKFEAGYGDTITVFQKP